MNNSIQMKWINKLNEKSNNKVTNWMVICFFRKYYYALTPYLSRTKVSSSFWSKYTLSPFIICLLSPKSPSTLSRSLTREPFLISSWHLPFLLLLVTILQMYSLYSLQQYNSSGNFVSWSSNEGKGSLGFPQNLQAPVPSKSSFNASSSSVLHSSFCWISTRINSNNDERFIEWFNMTCNDYFHYSQLMNIQVW